MNKVVEKELAGCTEDMKAAVQAGRMTLEAQVRAYDVLEYLSDMSVRVQESSAAAEFCREYETLAAGLERVYDEEDLLAQAAEALRPLMESMEAAAARAVQMTGLHDCARETYEIWQTAGIFARQKALRILRRKAGFRLESKRIGNYVAKTFDLMNEAMAAHARAQQAVFAADQAYKVKPGIYAGIHDALKRQ